MEDRVKGVPVRWADVPETIIQDDLETRYVCAPKVEARLADDDSACFQALYFAAVTVF